MNFIAQDKRKFLLLLSFVEMWERFSYYGMRALLVLYLITQLGFNDIHAYEIYAFFASVGYFGCVFFGYVSDKFFGPRYMVVFGGIIMMMGHIFMAISYIDRLFLYLGIAAIAVGTSAFKGNMTNILGLCYKDNKEKEAGYIVFYVAVNVGGFLASIICGTIGMKYDWHLGFGLAGIGMAIGLLTFISLYKKVLGNVGEMQQSNSIGKNLIFCSFLTLYLGIVTLGLYYTTYAINIMQYLGLLVIGYYFYLLIDGKSRKNLLALLILILFEVIFYALEMQTGGLIAVFASRNVDLTLFGYEIAATSVDAINPLTITIFGLLLSPLMKRNGSFYMKFTFGMLCMPLSFAIFYLGTTFATQYKMDINYFIIGMMTMAIGEIFIGPAIQTQASILTPKHLRGTVFGLVMFAHSYANILGNFAARYMSVDVSHGLDLMESLKIYQDGFIMVMKYTGVAALLFVSLIPVLKRLKASKQNLNH